MRPRGLGFLLVLLSLTACGGSPTDSLPSPPASGTTTTASPSRSPCEEEAKGPAPLCEPVNDGGMADVTAQGSSVELEMDQGPNLIFHPTYVKITPGAEVTVTVTNRQKVGDFSPNHSFTIDELEVHELLLPEETRTVTFTLPDDVEFVRFYCALAGHEAGGMQGAFYFA